MNVYFYFISHEPLEASLVPAWSESVRRAWVEEVALRRLWLLEREVRAEGA